MNTTNAHGAEKVIVIGGGVAGMTAGIYARKAGYDVEIYERNAVFGGNLTGWRRGECVIDNCIHWLTGTLPGTALNGVWREVGMLTPDTVLRRGEYFFRSERNGESLSFYADPEKTRREMLTLSPDDKRETDRLIDTVKALIPIVCDGSLFERAAILPRGKDLLDYRNATLYDVASRFSHPLIRLALTDYIGGEFAAAALLFAYAAFVSGNGSVPAGGSPAAATRMRDRCLDIGCILHPSTEVRRIAVRDDRADGIFLADGRFVASDHIIAACDPVVTFGKLLPAEWMPRGLKKRLEDPAMPQYSSIHAAFVCDTDAVLPFGTVIVDAPSFSERSRGRMPIREYSHEPTFAPEGKTVLQTLVFQTPEECLMWIGLAENDADAYRKKKDALGQDLLDAVVHALPELNGHIRLLDVWTPATYHRFTGSRYGSYMSYALTPETPLRTLSGRIPRLRNVILATQWLASPGGLPGAASSGVAAVKLLGKSAARPHSVIAVR